MKTCKKCKELPIWDGEKVKFIVNDDAEKRDVIKSLRELRRCAIAAHRFIRSGRGWTKISGGVRQRFVDKNIRNEWLPIMVETYHATHSVHRRVLNMLPEVWRSLEEAGPDGSGKSLHTDHDFWLAYESHRHAVILQTIDEMLNYMTT